MTKDGSLQHSEWKVLSQDNVPDMLMLWCLSENYDLHHGRAGSKMPKCL